MATNPCRQACSGCRDSVPAMSFGRGSHRIGASITTKTPVSADRRGHTVRRILKIFRLYRAQVAIVVVAILTTSLLGVINPILLKLLIDDALPPPALPRGD